MRERVGRVAVGEVRPDDGNVGLASFAAIHSSERIGELRRSLPRRIPTSMQSATRRVKYRSNNERRFGELSSVIGENLEPTPRRGQFENCGQSPIQSSLCVFPILRLFFCLIVVCFRNGFCKSFHVPANNVTHSPECIQPLVFRSINE